MFYTCFVCRTINLFWASSKNSKTTGMKLTLTWFTNKKFLSVFFRTRRGQKKTNFPCLKWSFPKQNIIAHQMDWVFENEGCFGGFMCGLFGLFGSLLSFFVPMWWHQKEGCVFTKGQLGYYSHHFESSHQGNPFTRESNQVCDRNFLIQFDFALLIVCFILV